MKRQRDLGLNPVSNALFCPWRWRSGAALVLLATALLIGGCSDDDETKNDVGPGNDAGLDGPVLDDASLDSAPAPLPLTVNLIHLNDSHGALDPSSMNLGFKDGTDTVKTYGATVGGISRAVAKVKAVRAEETPSLVLHAGDAMQGSLYFTEYEGAADVALLNLLGLDAMTLGNHEFDRPSQTLAAFIDAATFPVLGANVDASADEALKDKIAPYVIEQVTTADGVVPVAIIGLTTPETAIISSPSEDVTFNDPATVLASTIAALEARGVNKIVVLSHLGFEDDQELATVEGVDVIVGGHTHTVFGDFGDLGLVGEEAYPLEVTRGQDKVCIVQAGAKLQLIGVLQVQFSAAGAVERCQGNPVMPVADSFVQFNPQTKQVEPVDEATKTLILAQIEQSPVIEVVTPDAAAETALAPFKAGIEELAEEEIATVAQDLLHVRVPGTAHSSGTAMPKGSAIAPVICEAMLWKAAGLDLSPQAALINGGGVRTDILAGALTVGEVYTLLPFQNTLTLVELTGAELEAVLEEGVQNATAEGSKGGSFPYVAGIRYTADMSQPEGSRITTLELQSGSSWAAVQDATSYKLVTLDFLTRGGDGYTTLNALSSKTSTGFLDAESFMEYAVEKQTVQPAPADSGVTFLPAP